MKSPFYPFVPSSDCLFFEFDSISQQKVIRKIVGYTPLKDLTDGYNLGFGDLNENGSVDDLSKSNNADMEKVISTVVRTMLYFFDKYPDKFVYIEGSTSERTRLYRIIISKELSEISIFLNIYGLINDEIEEFKPNKPYDSFIISLKNKKYLRTLLYQNN